MEGLTQHPEWLSHKQIESIMTVGESAEEAVGKYCNIKWAMKLIFAVPMKGEFADVNEALEFCAPRYTVEALLVFNTPCRTPVPSLELQ